MTTSLAARAAKVRLLVLDVDGVLTDGILVYGPAGEEVKRFHVRDGYALVAARRDGSTVYYRLADPKVLEAYKVLQSIAR